MKKGKRKGKLSSDESDILYINRCIEMLYMRRKDKSAAGTTRSPQPSLCDSSDEGEFTYFEGEDIDAAYDKAELELLVSGAGMYRHKKYIGPEDERKTCIWPGGDPVSWTELSSGFSWIGVNGTDTTCVVTTCDAIRKRPAGKIPQAPEPVLRAALADMLGDTSFSFRRRIPQSSLAGPVAVVSVAPAVPGQECQQPSRAINFLMEKLKDRSSLSSKETEQIAICALKYLLGRKFKSNKIMVYGWGKWKGVRGRMSKRRVLRAINQTTTMDLTTSVSSISLSSP